MEGHAPLGPGHRIPGYRGLNGFPQAMGNQSDSDVSLLYALYNTMVVMK